MGTPISTFNMNKWVEVATDTLKAQTASIFTPMGTLANVGIKRSHIHNDHEDPPKSPKPHYQNTLTFS